MKNVKMKSTNTCIQNKATSGNFAKMKGKLPWPVNGKIISRFGNQKIENLIPLQKM